MLLLDFAVGGVNRSGGKKNHGDHSNNNTDREYLSVSNNNKELDQNQESSPLLRWSLIITRMLQLQATVKRFQFDLYVNFEGQQMLISSWFQK